MPISPRALRAWILTLTLIATGASAADADEFVVHEVSPYQLERLMNELGHTNTTIDQDGDIIVQIQGYSVLAMVGSWNGTHVSLATAFSGTNANLNNVNAWNRERRDARVYLDNQGDPVIEANLDVRGGITIGRLKAFIQTFASDSLPSFVQTYR